MTTLEQRLAATLDEHEAAGWMLNSRSRSEWTCLCGEGVDLPPEHAAHVAAHLAATVREWLGGEQVRQAVADAICPRHMGDAEAKHAACVKAASAALAAVREHLTGEGSDG